MSAVERRAWPLALAALVAGALVLRLAGLRTGLPYVYNADENAHFVPLAIGMFGHSLNPDYFVNPPAYTYLLHEAFGLRWGFDRAAIGHAFAVDPGAAFTIARGLSAVLGALAAGLLAIAGARLFDRRTGLVAGVLLAVAFLPNHYAHLALNDVPALAPLCLALVGVAGVLRAGRWLDFALAGIGLGLGAATKYTEGIVLLPLLAAAVLAPVAPGAKVRGLLLAGVLALGSFLVANPYALLDFDTFRAGLQKQSEASGDGGGKLGLTESSGLLYYLGTTTWGLGWLPALAALGGAVGLTLRDRRTALVLVPAAVLFLLFMGTQDRFFARWLLPIYPLLCLLAAWAGVGAAAWLAGRVRPAWRTAAWPAVVAGVLLAAQGVMFSVHNSVALARPDTRALARAWMVDRIPAGSKVVIEPIAPAQWAMDPSGPSDATATGNRWNKWPTSRFQGKVVKLEDYERTLRPSLVERYRRGGYCWVASGSTQYGRALAEPRAVPGAIAYYAALKRAADVVYAVSPVRTGARPVPFSFDFSFNAYPLRYDRMGPQISIYRLRDCRS
jgi:dolichyl-phosphate-mannose-protein mannosyltransferase